MDKKIKWIDYKRFHPNYYGNFLVVGKIIKDGKLKSVMEMNYYAGSWMSEDRLAIEFYAELPEFP